MDTKISIRSCCQLSPWRRSRCGCWWTSLTKATICLLVFFCRRFISVPSYNLTLKFINCYVPFPQNWHTGSSLERQTSSRSFVGITDVRLVLWLTVAFLSGYQLSFYIRQFVSFTYVSCLWFEQQSCAYFFRQLCCSRSSFLFSGTSRTRARSSQVLRQRLMVVLLCMSDHLWSTHSF